MELLGVCGRYQRMLQKAVRALRFQLEEQLGSILDPRLPIFAWLVRHASWLLYRFHVARDTNASAYLRVRGGPYNGRIVGFAESVLALTPERKDGGGPRHISKLSSRWSVGVWLGKTDESNEHLVCLGGQIGRFRTVRRYAVEDRKRWSLDAVEHVNVLPWSLSGRPTAPERPLPNLNRASQMPGPSGASVAVRTFPATPGCAACSRKGQYAHGFHHSIA